MLQILIFTQTLTFLYLEVVGGGRLVSLFFLSRSKRIFIVFGRVSTEFHEQFVITLLQLEK